MTPDISGPLADLQATFDEDEARGYRGARVDPNPNSAYSQETDPMTSPGSNERHLPFLIDEYMDPDNPDQERNHDRRGIVDDSEEDIADSTELLEADVPARGAAVDGNTDIGSVDFDGAATTATIQLDTALTGDATNNRVFTVRNTSKDVDMFRLTSTATIAADTDVSIPTLGAAAARDVSEGDELVLVETHGGTGAAHSVGIVKVTVIQAA